jgi:hypothetical protein
VLNVNLTTPALNCLNSTKYLKNKVARVRKIVVVVVVVGVVRGVVVVVIVVVVVVSEN